MPRRAAALTGGGAHASRNRGGGLEFAQYRAYEQGDEPRLIDWKLYARSDRLFVRDAERESPVAVWIVLDASASMTQADMARPDWSRFDAARRLAACVLEIALAGGDRFGLLVLSPDRPLLLAPHAGSRHRDRLLLALAPLAAAGIAEWRRDVARMAERIGPSDLVIVLTDGFDEAGVRELERLAAAGRDVAVIRILTADERDFPFDGGHRFVDPETGETLLGDGPAARGDFLTRFTAARAALDARLDAHGVRHAEHVIDKREDEAIRRLFAPASRP